MLDKRIAQDLSKKLKIDLFAIYREYFQLLFLKYLYSQKGTEKIYFKGGTALRLLFGSFRFSEDLDFTSLNSESELKVIIAKTLKTLKREMTGMTFREEKTISNAFGGRLFRQVEEFNFPVTVRLDFSLREKPQTAESSLIETAFPIGPYPQVTHLKMEEMMAEKIRAILIRTRGRDIFDLWFLLSKTVSIDWGLINKKMSLYRKKVDLEKLTSAVERVPQEEIKSDLVKFLPLNYRNLVEKIRELTLKKLSGSSSRELL